MCHRDLKCTSGMQAAVDRMLAPPPPKASAEAQQQHLKLLVEVYKRTQNLAEQLQVQSMIPLLELSPLRLTSPPLPLPGGEAECRLGTRALLLCSCSSAEWHGGGLACRRWWGRAARCCR